MVESTFMMVMKWTSPSRDKKPHPWESKIPRQLDPDEIVRCECRQWVPWVDIQEELSFDGERVARSDAAAGLEAE